MLPDSRGVSFQEQITHKLRHYLAYKAKIAYLYQPSTETQAVRLDYRKILEDLKRH